jgi:hypothetical protein
VLLLWLGLAVCFTVAVGAAVGASAKAANTVIGKWRAAMQALGLRFQRADEHRRMWRGQHEGQLVQAELDTVPQHGNYRMTLSTGAGLAIPPGLEVYCDSALQTLGRLVGGAERDVNLGDAAFDDVAVLSALDAYSCAALSHGTRQQLVLLLRRGGWVRQGRVALDGFWSWRNEAPSLVQQVRWLSKLATLLSVPAHALHERLARNALRDPAPAVRLHNLRFLVAAETRTPPALLASTARALLADVHAPVRLLAAQQLGAEGVPALRSLLAPGTAADATCTTLATLPRELARDLHESVLRCITSEHESVRAEAATLLGTWALPEAEPALLALLADVAPRVQQAAAQALGVLGSVAAVEHLLPLTQTVLDSQLRAAARAAVGSIQSRLGNVDAGRISLVEERSLAGAVALVEPAAARAGELSVVRVAGAEPGEAVDGAAEPMLHSVERS